MDKSITDIISEIRGHGYTDQAIGEVIGCSAAHVNRMRHGLRSKQPSFQVMTGLQSLLKRLEAEAVLKASKGMPEP
jgi:transcriptional regulator with XRE-family HTH domain